MGSFIHQQRSLTYRILHNRSAVAGLVIITCFCLMAVFAYLIIPDPVPDGNRMMLEIGGKKPGFEIDCLVLKKNKDLVSPSLLEQILQGYENGVELIPIIRSVRYADSTEVEKYIDDGVYEKIRYANTALADKPVIRRKYWLGTDAYGRDVWSRLIIGSRISLAVGGVAVFISLLLGVFLGSIAGYFGGSTDRVVMWLINVVWSLPSLLLVFAITLLMGKGFWQVFIAVGLTLWVNIARLVRAQVLSVKNQEYVLAAKVLGFSNTRIITHHILPNIAGSITVMAASNFAAAIIIESGLSFLGVGVQPPTPSWGLMIKENYSYLLTQNPILALAPGIAIMLAVFAFNLLGNGLRDAMDVRTIR